MLLVRVKRGPIHIGGGNSAKTWDDLTGRPWGTAAGLASTPDLVST